MHPNNHNDGTTSLAIPVKGTSFPISSRHNSSTQLASNITLSKMDLDQDNTTNPSTSDTRQRQLSNMDDNSSSSQIMRSPTTSSSNSNATKNLAPIFLPRAQRSLTMNTNTMESTQVTNDTNRTGSILPLFYRNRTESTGNFNNTQNNNNNNVYRTNSMAFDDIRSSLDEVSKSGRDDGSIHSDDDHDDDVKAFQLSTQPARPDNIKVLQRMLSSTVKHSQPPQSQTMDDDDMMATQQEQIKPSHASSNYQQPPSAPGKHRGPPRGSILESYNFKVIMAPTANPFLPSRAREKPKVKPVQTKLNGNTMLAHSMKFFEDLETLGEGSFSVVSRMRHRIDGCVYAIKRIKRLLRNSNADFRESQIMSAVCNCEHLLRYHTAWTEEFENETYLYIQMELAWGSLENAIEGKRPKITEPKHRKKLPKMNNNGEQTNATMEEENPFGIDGIRKPIFTNLSQEDTMNNNLNSGIHNRVQPFQNLDFTTIRPDDTEKDNNYPSMRSGGSTFPSLLSARERSKVRSRFNAYEDGENNGDHGLFGNTDFSEPSTPALHSMNKENTSTGNNNNFRVSPFSPASSISPSPAARQLFRNIATSPSNEPETTVTGTEKPVENDKDMKKRKRQMGLASAFRSQSTVSNTGITIQDTTSNNNNTSSSTTNNNQPGVSVQNSEIEEDTFPESSRNIRPRILCSPTNEDTNTNSNNSNNCKSPTLSITENNNAGLRAALTVLKNNRLINSNGKSNVPSPLRDSTSLLSKQGSTVANTTTMNGTSMPTTTKTLAPIFTSRVISNKPNNATQDNPSVDGTKLPLSQAIDSNNNSQADSQTNARLPPFAPTSRFPASRGLPRTLSLRSDTSETVNPDIPTMSALRHQNKALASNFPIQGSDAYNRAGWSDGNPQRFHSITGDYNTTGTMRHPSINTEDSLNDNFKGIALFRNDSLTGYGRTESNSMAFPIGSVVTDDEEYYTQQTAFSQGVDNTEQTMVRAVLTEIDLLVVLFHISKALAHLHDRGLAHLDVKPANILVVYQAGPGMCDRDGEWLPEVCALTGIPSLDAEVLNRLEQEQMQNMNGGYPTLAIATSSMNGESPSVKWSSDSVPFPPVLSDRIVESREGLPCPAHITNQSLDGLNVYRLQKIGKLVYKLGDLGQCVPINNNTTEVDEGDIRYVARELLNQDVSVGSNLPATDIFSLALTIFELAIGQPLPSGGPEWHALRDEPLPANRMPHISAEFHSLLCSMAHNDPNCRPTAVDILHHPVFNQLNFIDSSYNIRYGSISNTTNAAKPVESIVTRNEGFVSPPPYADDDHQMLAGNSGTSNSPIPAPMDSSKKVQSVASRLLTMVNQAVSMNISNSGLMSTNSLAYSAYSGTMSRHSDPAALSASRFNGHSNIKSRLSDDSNSISLNISGAHTPFTSSSHNTSDIALQPTPAHDLMERSSLDTSNNNINNKNTEIIDLVSPFVPPLINTNSSSDNPSNNYRSTMTGWFARKQNNNNNHNNKDNPFTKETPEDSKLNSKTSTDTMSIMEINNTPHPILQLDLLPKPMNNHDNNIQSEGIVTLRMTSNDLLLLQQTLERLAKGENILSKDITGIVSRNETVQTL